MFRHLPQIGGVKLAPMVESLLPSTLVVRGRVEDSEYGDEWSEPVEIQHVRFTRSSEFSVVNNSGVTSGYVFQDGSRGLIYVDAVNSSGAFDIPEGSEVRVDGGERMEVVKVTKCDNLDGTLHHYEIEVK